MSRRGSEQSKQPQPLALQALQAEVCSVLGVEPDAIAGFAAGRDRRDADRWTVETAIDVPDAGRVVLVFFDANADRPSFCRTEEVAVSYRSLVDADACPALVIWLNGLEGRWRRSSNAWTAALSHAMPEILQNTLAPLGLQPEAAETPETRGQRVTPDELGEEGAVLRPLIDAFGSHYGETIGVHRRDDLAADAFALRFPAIPSALGTFLRLSPEVRSAAKWGGYLTSLGFVSDPDNHLRTVPTPETFRRIAASALPTQTGFLPRLVETDSLFFSSARWLGHMVRGEIPINVATPGFYRRTAWLRTPPLRGFALNRDLWHTHYHAVGHDMSTHVFPLHRVPEAFVREIGGRVSEALASLRLARGPFAPAPLATFYENDLTRHCRDLWNAAESPEAFDTRFSDSAPNILSQLESRLDQLRNGTRLSVYLGPGRRTLSP